MYAFMLCDSKWKYDPEPVNQYFQILYYSSVKLKKRLALIDGKHRGIAWGFTTIEGMFLLNCTDILEYVGDNNFVNNQETAPVF